MKVDWNKKTNTPIVEFEDSDYSNADQIKEFMEGHFMCRKCSTINQNKAWEILQGYYESWRLAIEEIGKSNARSRVKNALCGNVFSVLDGFDQAVSIPKKIILQAEMMREYEKKKKKLEEQNAEPEYE